MVLQTRILKGDGLKAAIDEIAELRIKVFADYPYLYEGNREYETRYLEPYQTSDTAIVVAVYDGERMAGCATGMVMEDHADEFANGLKLANVSETEVFYCAESVLLPEYRGRGVGHVFFDERENHARKLGRKYSAFCGVIRPVDHPKKPHDYSPLDGFWHKRGYRKVEGAISTFSWQEIGESHETAHQLQFWIRELMPDLQH